MPVWRHIPHFDAVWRHIRHFDASMAPYPTFRRQYGVISHISTPVWHHIRHFDASMAPYPTFRRQYGTISHISTKSKKITKSMYANGHEIAFDIAWARGVDLRWAFARPSIHTEYTIGGRAAELLIMVIMVSMVSKKVRMVRKNGKYVW